jgi:hypothetical protein
MKSEELIEKLRATQIDSEITGQPLRCDVKIQDLLDAFAEKDVQIASLKGEISKIQGKMCEDVFEGIMPSEHIVCRPLQQAAKRIAELKQSVSCDASVANYRKNLIKELEFKVDRLTEENRRLINCNEGMKVYILRLLRGMWHAIGNWARAERKLLENRGYCEEAQKWLNVEHKGLERAKQYRG